MALMYYGKFQPLKAMIQNCGVTGRGYFNWAARRASFVANTGEVVNWWVDTKQIQIIARNSPEFTRKLTAALLRARRQSRQNLHRRDDDH